MKLRLQRWYAFAVFLLRDVFRTSPFDQLFEWKAQTVMTLSQLFLLVAAVITLAASLGRLPSRLNGVFVGFGAVLFVALYCANGEAQRRLLPRFEKDFHRIRRTRRIAATVGLLLFLLLTVLAFFGSAAVAHKRLAATTGQTRADSELIGYPVTASMCRSKNDAADAEAICEAVGRPKMRFVPIKNIEQQGVLALHRVRQGFVKARTAQANQVRGLLAELG